MYGGTFTGDDGKDDVGYMSGGTFLGGPGVDAIITSVDSPPAVYEEVELVAPERCTPAP